MTKYFSVPAKELSYDVVVAGGGVAGVAAALNAARNGVKTALIDSGGELGGDITKGFVPQLLDPKGKRGFVEEINNYLNQGGHTAARRGPHYDENGKKIPGTLIETEYLKYFFDKVLRDAGVDVFYYSVVCAADVEDGNITSVMLATEAGNYALQAKVFIDSTGNGQLAAMVGCDYEFGHPGTGKPQPASMGMLVTGIPEDFQQTDSDPAKEVLKAQMAEAGVHISSNQLSMVRAATDNCWLVSGNFQYDVPHDDILGLSNATRDGRIECVEIAEALRKLPGFEKVTVLQISSHLGIREGKRILGQYQLNFDDITSGRQFEDAVCLVRFGVDVHAIEANDKRDHKQGKRVIPYHIPYRSLLPLGCNNLLLAGRCISGDFYAHASYRVACDVIPTGEAAGYAAAVCVKDNILPGAVDGKAIRRYIASLGYEL